MPRYEPTPSEQESLIPQTSNNGNNTTATSNTSAPVPRYLQQPGETGQRPPNSRYQTRSQFLFLTFYLNSIKNISTLLSNSRQTITGYLSGFLFALGWWIFIDGCVFNAIKYVPGSRMNVLAFEDWIPGVLSTIALIMYFYIISVNLIDRESLNAEDSGYDSSNVATKARAIAFVGITIALGSLGGALAILSLKYIIPQLSGEALYLVLEFFNQGQAITIQNFLIFISSMSLWFGRNFAEDPSIVI